MEHVRVFVEEGAHRDIESEDVSPAGHEGEGDEGSALAGGHEVVDFEDKVESFELIHEFVEVGVSYSVLQTGSGGNGGFLPSALDEEGKG